MSLSVCERERVCACVCLCMSVCMRACDHVCDCMSEPVRVSVSV